MVICGVASLLWQRTVLSFAYTPTPFNTTRQVFSTIQTIQIPSIGIDNNVTGSSIRNGIWQTSRTGVSHLAVSANPGEPGNIILYGHNSPTIFKTLLHIKIGQPIYVITADGKTHVYKTEKIAIVSPSDITSVQASDHEILTVYTCTGFLDTKRFIVQALPI